MRGYVAAILATVVAALVLTTVPAPTPAEAIEFKTSKFRRAGAYGTAMVRAWEKGRSSAKASAFFVANKQGRLLVMTASHVVGRSPIFSYRGRRSRTAKRVLRHNDVAIYEVSFGGGVSYGSVGKFYIERARPSNGQRLTVVGYPKGFSGSLMVSGNCQLMPRSRLLHPSFFSCADLDRWCDYAEKAGKSRTTCLADEKDVRRGRKRQCALPLERRHTRHLRHRESTHAMNCAARLGNSGGPVILAKSTRSRGVIGMPSAVFARVYGAYPDTVGVGVAAFSQSFKAKARRLGIEVR
ncbi:MAG: hypothetical protein AAGD34_03075 [Pseudomonadota bacterium]